MSAMMALNDLDLVKVVISGSFWTGTYSLLCWRNSTRGFEWHCRLVTLLHALVVTSMSLYCTIIVGPSPYTDAGGPNTQLQVVVVSISLGYFLFDFTWCLYFQTEGLVMIAHHAVTVLGLTWCLVSGYFGTEIVATLAGAEVTNPLLQLRWFLRATGQHKSLLAVIVDWVFMLSFGFVRIGLGSWLVYSYYMQDTSFWGRVGVTSIYIISWIFFISIVNYALRKYVGQDKRKQHSALRDDDTLKNVNKLSS